MNKQIKKIWLITCFLLLNVSGLVAAEKNKESALKIAYLYYFSKFVKWPDDIVNNKETVNLCIGNMTKEEVFQLSTIEGKNVGNKFLKIIMLKKKGVGLFDLTSLKQCHLLYISYSMIDWYQQYNQRFPDHILTVSKNKSIVKPMIYLYNLNNKLRFEVDHIKAEKHKIKISSKLLMLSRRGKS